MTLPYQPPSWDHGEFRLNLAFGNTGKLHNICFMDIRTLFRDQYAETLISDGTTWALSTVRTRVPCGCATTSVTILLPSVVKWFTSTNTSHAAFKILKAFWSALWSVVLTRLTSPAHGCKDYVTTYRKLPNTCHAPQIQECFRLVANLRTQMFARIATSADASAANAKDMDVDLRTPRGTVDDTAVLQVRDNPPLYFLRSNFAVVNPSLLFRR